MNFSRELSGILILWKRELVRYSRARSRVVSSIAMPFFILLFLGTGLNSAFTVPGGGNYLEFMVPGVIGMVLLFSSIFIGMTVLVDKQFGFLKEILVAPISRVSIVLGRALGGVTIALFQAFIMILAVLFLGVQLSFAQLPLVLLFMFLISLGFVSLGIAIASLMEDIHGFQLVMNFLVMPMFFLSGALFPVEGLPEWLKFLVILDPLTYGVDGLRGAFGGTSAFPLSFDLAVLACFSLATVFLGAWLFRKRS